MSSFSVSDSRIRSDVIFTVSMLAFVVLAFALTAAAPIAVSVVIVFLFAGPHNYAEARYFLTRLPARLGRLKPFFLLSAAGVISLTVAYPLLTRIPGWLNWRDESAIWLICIWNTVLIFWGTALVAMRSSQAPRRDWDFAWPIGIAAAGLCWLQPVALPLLLVYLHPLMGLWILDRELQRSRPEWRRAFRCCVLLLPFFVTLLWRYSGLQTSEAWMVSSQIRNQISGHVGAVLFSESTGRRLIAIHAFLELLHYGVWLIAVPTVSGRVFSRAFASIPLMRRPRIVRTLIRTMLAGLAIVVAALWLCFAADYQSTRDVYFTVATLHVLAEVPFLLRLL